MILIYVWLRREAPLARKASVKDLLQALAKYPSRAIAKAATDTFSRHLWYSSDILVGLSFFDDRNMETM